MMDKNIFVEFAKVIVPAIASSGLVAYYFQKKLKRVGSYEGVTKMLLEKLLHGTEDVYSKIKSIHNCVLDLEVLINGNQELHIEKLRNIMNSLQRQISGYTRALEVHRIYITSLIPLGGSTPYHDMHTALLINIQLYLKASEEGNQRILQDATISMQEIVEKNKEQYDQVCNNINSIKKKIMNGDIVL